MIDLIYPKTVLVSSVVTDCENAIKNRKNNPYWNTQAYINALALRIPFRNEPTKFESESGLHNRIQQIRTDLENEKTNLSKEFSFDILGLFSLINEIFSCFLNFFYNGCWTSSSALIETILKSPTTKPPTTATSPAEVVPNPEPSIVKTEEDLLEKMRIQFAENSQEEVLLSLKTILKEDQVHLARLCLRMREDLQQSEIESLLKDSSTLNNRTTRFLQARLKELKKEVTIKDTDELIQLILKNALDGVKQKLACGMDVDKKNAEGTTPFMAAIKANKEEIALYLLEQGVDLLLVDEKKHTPLLCAVSLGNLKLVTAILQKTSDLEKKQYVNKKGGTDADTTALLEAFLAAHKHKDPEQFVPIISQLLEAGAVLSTEEERQKLQGIPLTNPKIKEIAQNLLKKKQ